MRLAILAALAALSASSALAADAVPFEPAPVVDFESAPQRSVLLGAGIGVAPAYEGSDEYRVFPFPIFSYDSGVDGPRRFEFRALDDIRLHALRLNGFSAGPVAGYSFGREEDVSDDLRGLGDVDGGVVLGGFAAYDFEISPTASVGVDLAVSTQVTGDAYDDDPFRVAGLSLPLRRRVEDNYGYGYVIDFGASGSVDVSPRLNIAGRVGAEYASDEYMRTFFGVNGAQSLAASTVGNSIPTFGTAAPSTVINAGGVNPVIVGNAITPAATFADQLDGQVKNVYLNANAAFDVTDRFQVRAGAGYSRLIGDAADSPISQSDNQLTGSLGVGYRFRF